MSFLGQFLFFFSPLHSVLSAKSLEGEKGMEGSGEGEGEGAEAKLRPSIPPGIFINWLAELAGCLVRLDGLCFYFPFSLSD